MKNEIIDLYNEVFFKSNNKLKISLEEQIEELNNKRDKLINLNISNIISSDELKNRLNKNDMEISKLKDKLSNIDTKNNYYERLKNIELEIDNISNVFNNLNIYTNLLIDKIIVTKLDTRYKMNLEIYFNDGSIKNIYYEN